MILLFSISSTIRASNAQKLKPNNALCACTDFYGGLQRIRNAAEKFVGSKYKKNM